MIAQFESYERRKQERLEWIAITAVQFAEVADHALLFIGCFPNAQVAAAKPKLYQ